MNKLTNKQTVGESVIPVVYRILTSKAPLVQRNKNTESILCIQNSLLTTMLTTLKKSRNLSDHAQIWERDHSRIGPDASDFKLAIRGSVLLSKRANQSATRL